MKLPRRSFLAALLAPIAARFLPKPNPVAGQRVFDDALIAKARQIGMTNAYHFGWTGVDLASGPDKTVISLGEVVNKHGEYWYTVTEYWQKGKAPFVVFNAGPWPWEKPEPKA